MGKDKSCYICGGAATTREHMPPKSFFPKGGDLQLKTVPSCKIHNNDKSGDDQYLLAHICMNAASGDNLPKKLFLRSIAPAFSRGEGFRKILATGSVGLPGGVRKYKVDTSRFDNFFNHLSFAIYFDRYGVPLNRRRHTPHHYYLSLASADSEELQRRTFLTTMLGKFFRDFEGMIATYEADKINESVYRNKILDPGGKDASITIAHTFYGIFEAVSLLTRTFTERDA